MSKVSIYLKKHSHSEAILKPHFPQYSNSVFIKKAQKEP